MPEGDTIHRAANRLRPALAGQPLVRLEVHRAPALARRPAPGTTIAAVAAVGKHLLVRFADGAVLRTHLGMSGSWHLYATGEPWRKPAHLVRALVEVPGWIAVCFSAPTAVLERGERPDGIAHLGPDLAAPDVDDAALDVATERMATLPPDTDAAVALLDQRVACGIGNVFKSEVLWACRVSPFAPVGDLDTETCRRLLATASSMLRANVVAAGRRTTHPRGLAVYGRSRRPCRRCGTPIRSRRQGEQARSTYWCPSCQPDPVPSTATQ